MSDLSFDMPPAAAGFPARGRWLIDRLMAVLDLTENQAAGIVGNLGYESIGLTTLQEIKPLVPGSRGGYGWAQWTGPRRRALEAFAELHGIDPSGDVANYEFLLHELTGSHAYVVNALHKTETLEDAAFVVGRLYEAPGGTTETHLPGFEGRVEWAQKALSGVVQPAGSDNIDFTIAELRRIVAELQTKLKARGLYTGAIDGDFGPRSRSALRMYQEGRS